MQIFGQPKGRNPFVEIGVCDVLFRLCTEKKKIFEKNKIRGLQPWIFVIYYLSIRGGIAQLGEHLPCKQGVKSSNLFISTTTSRRAFWFAAFFIKKIRLHFIGCRSFVPQNLSGFAGGTLHLAVLFCRCSSFFDQSSLWAIIAPSAQIFV